MPRDKIITVLGALLFLSLAGNLFMAGHMLGQRAAQGEAPKPQDDRRAEWKKRDDMLREKLSDADRKVFEDVKALNRPRIEALKSDLEAAREQVAAAQMADPFDAQAMEAAVKAEAEKKAVFLKAIREMRREIAQQLSPEGRAEMQKLAPRRADKGMERRRGGEMRERLRERRGNGERPLRDRRPPPPHEGQEGIGTGGPEGIGMGPGGPAFSGPASEMFGGPSPAMPPPRDYGEPPPPPPADDCGGCEVPSGDGPETPPEP